jgi:hypothetical protein
MAVETIELDGKKLARQRELVTVIGAIGLS